MRQIPQTNRTGWHMCPPVSHTGFLAALPSLLVISLSLHCLLLCGGVDAQINYRAQGIFMQRAQNRKQTVRKPGVPRPGTPPRADQNLQKAAKLEEKEVRRLLRWMLKPQTDFSGMESTTARNADGSITSDQEIRGDTKGRVLRRFLKPDTLKDDFMLTGNSLYLYYSARQKTVVREGSGLEQQLEKFIQEGLNSTSVRFQITGHRQVAGRNATVIEISSPSSNVTLWLDSATGIKLSHEIRDDKNLSVSRSWLTSVTIGAESGVTDQDFQRKEFESGKPADLREDYPSIAEAAAKANLKFMPKAPTVLPTGFRLTKVTVVTATNLNVAPRQVILHFSDRVSNFTLQERVVRAGKGASENLALRPNQWRISHPGGLFDLIIIFRGRLPQEQIQAIHDSLK